MRKIERVAKFVDTFLEQAFAELQDARRQTAEFLAQRVQRNHHRSSAKLCFAKYKYSRHTRSSHREERKPEIAWTTRSCCASGSSG
jgi:hypothetical protein